MHVLNCKNGIPLAGAHLADEDAYVLLHQAHGLTVSTYEVTPEPTNNAPAFHAQCISRNHACIAKRHLV